MFIIADDLGYGDLSCFGQKHFKTPNIDDLAQGGLVFTQHYAGSPVCAPSRSALMTGLHTGHTYIRGNREVVPEGQFPLPDSAVTLGEIFKTKGYTTGIFGKWGLGYEGSEGDPMNQGFDRMYGYMCQRLAHNYYPPHLWNDQENFLISENAGPNNGAYGPELIQQQTLEFIEQNKEQPFFLFVPSIMPHAELAAPQSYMEKYRGKFDPETPFKGATPETNNFKKGPYASQAEPRAAFAAMVNVLDDQVGEIVAKLKSLGLYENTIIVFTSDNGPHQEGGADPDFFDSNGPLRGYKRDVYEGGIRVPLIIHWAEKIKPGKTDHISAFWDFIPTFAELVGSETPVNIDGISMMPTLTGSNTDQKQHDLMYWEFHEQGGKQAIRKNYWKFVKLNVNDSSKTSFELYNLESDLGETNNLAGTYPDTLNMLKPLLEGEHIPNPDFKFAWE